MDSVWETCRGKSASWITALLLLAPGMAPADEAGTAGYVLSSPPALKGLALTPDEYPLDYAPVTSSNVLFCLGMTSNPGIIRNPYEVDVLNRWGGTTSVGAVYGRQDEPLLMMNAICFPGETERERFLQFQRTLRCRTLAFARTDAEGAWLLLWAVDRKRDYPDEELRQLVASVSRHAMQRGFHPLAVDRAYFSALP